MMSKHTMPRLQLLLSALAFHFSTALCKLDARASIPGAWSLVQQGTTGVSGMQLAITSETTAIIYDKVEHNPLTVNGHVAWAVELNINTQQVRALNPLSNSWCATGSFLGNGTLVNSGGNPVVITGASGLQGLRLFTPCSTGTCDVYENPTRIRLTSARWYPSSVRIQDGSIIIFGGYVNGGFINNAGMNNPSYEFFPPKNINGFNGLKIPSQFLKDTLNGNHFPNLVLLPDGTLFVSANQQAMILNWQTNTETRLPGIPNGVRISSPFSAGHVLLPLSPSNNYTPEIMICGGSTISDTEAASSISSQAPTSAQCIRMVLNTAGIAKGWAVETMPQGRIMLDMVLLPDGRVMIVNGAQTGVAGYGNVGNQIGQSNADNPAFLPVIYDPAAPAGSRFSTAGLVASTIPRLYHSTATLTPNGTVMLAGSNPNNDVTTVKYPTEYRLEFFSPPYMNVPRPSYTGLPATINYNVSFNLAVTLPANTTNVTVALMDLGFQTHGVHMDQRLVQLVSTLSADKKTLTVHAPPTSSIYPPGPAYLYVVTNSGAPSFGHKTIVGTGASPPVDQAAIANMLANTSGPSAAAQAATFQAMAPSSGEGSDVATAVIPA
ncbi:glyoxal oxidase N-terminus-domain-containing protein [Roridomyces roridus]|uniref:Glyoxal oxidase N-terminus-domain-containing protein n=1 Tax=Roridomyces roridus TaxID=1738132 RepID=A0AAD7B2I6_9AGAR|nr:glyoxal oxidase N-terminus-domain-containing protein [Roridomyces roridus]